MSLATRARALFRGPTVPDPLPIPTGDESGTYGAPAGGYVKAVAAALEPLTRSRTLTSKHVEVMRRDPQLAACLTVLALGIIRADWTIECDDDDVRETLTAQYDVVAADLHRSLARALWAGYSPNVLVWDTDPALGLYVSKIRDLPPFTCEALVNAAGSYRGLVQNRDTDAEVTVEPLRTLWVAEAMESGNYYGRSVLEAALEPWQDGVNVRLFNLRALERFGEPVVVTRAPAGQVVGNAREIADAVAKGEQPPAPVMVDGMTYAQQLGEGLRHHSVVSLPSEQHLNPVDGKAVAPKWAIEYLESTAAGDAFRDDLERLNRLKARATFIPDLLFTNSDTGAYALGKEHRSIFDAHGEARLDDYGRQTTRHLIDRARVFNFGADAPRARLVYAPRSDANREALWQLASAIMLGEGQGYVTDDRRVDVEAIAADLGIPVVEVETAADTVEGDSAGKVAASPFSNVGLPALVAAKIISATEARGLLGIEGEAPADTAPAEPDPVDDPAPEGDPAEAEQLAARVGRLLGEGREIDADLRGRTRAALGLSTARPVVHLAAGDPEAGDELPEWKRPQALDPGGWRRDPNARESRASFGMMESALNAAERATIAAVAELLDKSRDRVLRQLAGILAKGSEAEIIAALGTLNVGAPSPFSDAWKALTLDVWGVGLDAIRAELPEHLAGQVPEKVGAAGRALAKVVADTSSEAFTVGMSSALRTALLNAVASNVTSAGMAAIVNGMYDEHLTREGRPLRLTTRMLASRALNEGRADAIERGGVPLRGAQYSALLDSRVCDLCERLDETVIAITHSDFGRFTPPVHHNCRCVWVYITTDEADFTETWATPPSSLVDRYGGLVI